MDVRSIRYRKGVGWSDAFPALDSKQTLVVAFGDPAFGADHAPIDELVAAYPNAVVAGCSSSGEIFQDSVDDETLSVAIVRFQQSSVVSAEASVASAGDSHRAGAELAQALNASDLRSVLVFSDGLCVNGTELVQGFNSVLDDDDSHVVEGPRGRFVRVWNRTVAGN